MKIYIDNQLIINQSIELKSMIVTYFHKILNKFIIIYHFKSIWVHMRLIKTFFGRVLWNSNIILSNFSSFQSSIKLLIAGKGSFYLICFPITSIVFFWINLTHWLYNFLLTDAKNFNLCKVVGNTFLVVLIAQNWKNRSSLYQI